MIKLLVQIKRFLFFIATHIHYMAALGCYYSEKSPLILAVYLMTCVRAFDQGKSCKKLFVGNLCKENTMEPVSHIL
jgi:hypothetical protein